MKKWIKQALVFALVLTMALGCTVSASAAGDESNRLHDVTVSEGYTLTLLDVGGNEVDAVQEDVDGTTTDVYKDVVKMELAFTGEVGEQYVVFLLNGGSATPVQGNVRYIDQKSGQAGMEFLIYPDQLTAPGTYTLHISDSDRYTQVGSLTVAEPAYVVGDVDEDGAVTASDAAMVLRIVAEQEDDVTANQLLAANVDGDNAVTASDAAKILRVVAEQETFE